MLTIHGTLSMFSLKFPRFLPVWLHLVISGVWWAGWDFPEEIPEKLRKDPGNALRVFPGIPLESTAGIPQTL